ncbi:MAG: hypothetical protein R3B47_00245 [Bacteroidia bacterium]
MDEISFTVELSNAVLDEAAQPLLDKDNSWFLGDNDFDFEIIPITASGDKFSSILT